MTDNFPIDIDFKRVIEWMVDRKKLSKDWANKHKAIILKMQEIMENNTIQS